MTPMASKSLGSIDAGRGSGAMPPASQLGPQAGGRREIGDESRSFGRAFRKFVPLTGVSSERG